MTGTERARRRAERLLIRSAHRHRESVLQPLVDRLQREGEAGAAYTLGLVARAGVACQRRDVLIRVLDRLALLVGTFTPDQKTALWRLLAEIDDFTKGPVQ